TTPYWGVLPEARAAADAKARRGSDDYGPGDRKPQQPLDPQPPQPHANRASVQTTNTVYTSNTDSSSASPFASPTAASFAGQGLAPRPPSLPYSASQYQTPDLLEKRRRRENRNRAEEIERQAAASLPAAPDVPRPPPVSYKHPYGNGG